MGLGICPLYLRDTAVLRHHSIGLRFFFNLALTSYAEEENIFIPGLSSEGRLRAQSLIFSAPLPLSRLPLLGVWSAVTLWCVHLLFRPLGSRANVYSFLMRVVWIWNVPRSLCIEGSFNRQWSCWKMGYPLRGGVSETNLDSFLSYRHWALLLLAQTLSLAPSHTDTQPCSCSKVCLLHSQEFGSPYQPWGAESTNLWSFFSLICA